MINNELSLNPDTLLGKMMELVQRRKPANTELRLTIDNFVRSAETCDMSRLTHQSRVSHLCCAIGEKLGLNHDTLRGLSVSASLHDLGLLRVSDAIIGKSSKLTEAEIELIERHPQTGYEYLRHVDFPWPVAEIVLQHHEHFDGSGYPKKLTGEQIRFEARIICLADTVEAITSMRPHRSAATVKEAAKEIVKGRGLFYDPDAVDAFLQLVWGGKLFVKGWDDQG
ncbi:MAG: HD domain-containing protein [Proteobacteria bacterium]|nr:HD domain-containing protein [Pseudomonadota bacterium]